MVIGPQWEALMSSEDCRNVIIGSGEGGKYLAWHLAQQGDATMVIERKYIGGSCPNINCLPTKNEIWSAKVAHLVKHASEFGTNTGAVSVDIDAVRRRKRQMVDGLIDIHKSRYKATGARLVMGSAKFVGKKKLEVHLMDADEVTVSAERVFLNLGTHAAIPPIPGLAESDPLTHVEVLELDRLPHHLVVIGGGYVGLEFAQAYRRFGSEVTVLQRGAHLLSNQDEDVSEELRKILVAEGVDVVNSADVKSVSGRSGDEVQLEVQTGDGRRTIAGSHVLVASGRTPNTRGIGLDVAGVELDHHGYIKVNDRLETTAPDVWAIGECAGSPQFTHASLDDYRIIRDNLAGGNRSKQGRLMPSCLFTDPQVAHVGLTETEAKRNGVAVQVARLPMAAVLRTRTISEMQGFMKALIAQLDGRILGFTMVGAEAGEVMGVVQMVMQAGLPFTALRDGVLAHPTMAEGLNSLFSGVKLESVLEAQEGHGKMARVVH
jgi:pyruvate/2-oxoglutarate dehydrogenase complex dihydrolipoamide dehydrogenase (E3) component